MKAKAKILLGILVLGLGIFAISVLPRLARTIDASLERGTAQAIANESHYQNMTNAYPIAAEVSPGHPTRQLWEESRAALIESGYVETREIRLGHGLTRKGDVNKFFADFQAQFPGVECGLKEAKSEQSTAIVTARKSDLGTLGRIERWLRQYQPSP